MQSSRPNSWQLFTDDAAERAAFANLDGTLQHESTKAGPPNRLRQVTCIEFGGRRYFLKTFQRTQPKNRLRFLTTRPLAKDDADRECKVTQALRAHGVAAPRPIAYGRRGATSYYLCCELAGEPLADLLAAGRIDAQLLRASAAFCGTLLRAGFSLPDLSADHVFVADATRFAVLDLHNGALAAAPGTPSRKLLRRVLRRFARSVRELPIAREAAIRFALRLLRQAGAGRELRRSLLTAAQSFGTAARYEQDGRSRRYADRNPARTAEELRLLAAVWPGRPHESVLDLPCGAGRLLPFLQERGHRVVQADGAFGMLRETSARQRSGGQLVQADALRMPFADAAVDGLVLFRFLHHLPPDARRVALAEACRVASRFVVVSFFHPCSTHHVRRRLQALTGRPATRFAMTLGALRRQMQANGFGLVRHQAQLPYARDLWLASFERDAGAAPR
ncbi:MAG: methyltransferase domain-containing protein [Planctomycetota bacterium]